jgi:hypothetical protein
MPITAPKIFAAIRRGSAQSWTVAALAMLFLLNPVLARADMVLDWNGIMLTTLTGQTPFASARFAAITQLAVFQAVNAITGDYEAYLETVVPPAPGASAEAAAAAAAHAVLKAYFPLKAGALDAAFTTSLLAIPNGAEKTDGVAVGEAAARAMIALRADDGSASAEFYLPTSNAPGQWQLTPGCSASGGILLHWRHVVPFGIPAAEDFRLGPPPKLTGGTYSKDYVEVMGVGGADSVLRPPDRAEVARFYAAYSPVSWSNSAARQVAAAQGRSLSENARAFALLNMALSDATVAAFDTKYYYTAWRPETAIRAGDTDDNPKTDPDVAFQPFIVTPCFPSYPSNHASVSYAAREILEHLYGRTGLDITLSSANTPGVILSYTEFKRITEDIDDARVYGGIHFRFDQDAGARQGQSVGAYVHKHNLRTVHP